LGLKAMVAKHGAADFAMKQPDVISWKKKKGGR
jgi:hypothetical protein